VSEFVVFVQMSLDYLRHYFYYVTHFYIFFCASVALPSFSSSICTINTISRRKMSNNEKYDKKLIIANSANLRIDAVADIKNSLVFLISNIVYFLVLSSLFLDIAC